MTFQRSKSCKPLKVASANPPALLLGMVPRWFRFCNAKCSGEYLVCDPGMLISEQEKERPSVTKEKEERRKKKEE